MRMQMAATAWLVDSFWYIFLAVLFGMPFMLRGFRAFAPRLNILMGGGVDGAGADYWRERIARHLRLKMLLFLGALGL